MKTATRQQLLDQQLALSAYLDALLQVTPTTGAAAAPPSAAAAEATIGARPTTAAWSQSRFQALLFEVAGLTLAVPLVKLTGLVSPAAKVTPMPGHSPLLLGVLPYQGAQSRVVDTARFVLPAQRAARLTGAPGDRCRHLVMIDEGRWALACSRIGDVVDLDPADVKWRSARCTRLWLAGTVMARLCALLDVDALARELVMGVR